MAGTIAEDLEFVGCLEMFEQIGKGGELHKCLAIGRNIHDFMLEDPSEIVGHEDGVQAGRECRVYIRARRVADHPGMGGVADMVGDQFAVSLFFLFGKDFDGREKRFETGALQLVGLLFKIAFGDQDAAMALADVFEGFCNVGQ